RMALLPPQVSLPHLPRPRLKPPHLPPALSRAMPRLIEPLGKIPGFRRIASELAIDHYATAALPRPRPLTMQGSYTTWRGLTDRTWTGRHLPPREDQSTLPDPAAVVDLFRRKSFQPSTDTSVMFMFFAQWFTDSFLRTSRADPRRNTSNHEIDLCQVYGLSEVQTQLLRAHAGGRLKTQQIDGVEYPVFLFEPRPPGEPAAPLRVKEEFTGLHDDRFLIDVILGGATAEAADAVFAVGLEHGNATLGQTMMNVVFFREHNRVAGHLADAYPAWDDDRLFETARNIMIVLTLKLVVEEYICHIAPFDFPVELVPGIASGARWNRSNWCAVEFDLLYRWHPLAPDEVPGDEAAGETALGPGQFINNNPLVLAHGVEALMAQCSRARAGRIGLHNTPWYLTDRSTPDRPSVEERSVALMRTAQLASYNDYRCAFSLPKVKSFEELTKDAATLAELRSLYRTVDDVEWYVGIFAEDYPDYCLMGELMTTMVAHDAFTQALTNPLLGARVFNDETLSPLGMQIYESTGSLREIVARNAADPEAVTVRFSC
ncbi:MAG: prostaglandin-endoperoxide synthase 2, partial [Frankiaceae bacterium]|nr:prostaglandin-endoperoxide synthase 2 [Frankiaceae bacterium]